MLIFGSSVGDWREKSAYALDKADNQFAEVREIRCEGIEDVPTAMAFMAALAGDTQCKEFIYHATVNLLPRERLTKEQWFKVIDELEKRLGLEGHYRIAFEHIKKDRQHYHIYWSRLPPGNGGPAVNMGNDYRAHQSTAIHFEKEFGLKPAIRKARNKPSHKNGEIKERNNQNRADPDIVSEDVTRIFHASKTAKDFIKSLDKAGYTLTRSKKDKLVLVDQKGGYHGLIRRLDGVKASAFWRKFPELETMALPSLASVLRNKRPPSVGGFKKAASGFSRKRSIPTFTGGHRRGHNPFVVTPRMRSIESILAETRARYRPKEKKKHYPAPMMRKRRRKKEDENKLAKGGPTKAEIENAELLRFAWDNHRTDILAQFGIHILPENPTLYEMVQFGVLPPDVLEP